MQKKNTLAKRLLAMLLAFLLGFGMFPAVITEAYASEPEITAADEAAITSAPEIIAEAKPTETPEPTPVPDAAAEAEPPAESPEPENQQPDDSEKSSNKHINDWSWDDAWDCVEEGSDGSCIRFPGASPENPASFSDVLEILPAAINAIIDGIEERIAITWIQPENFNEPQSSGTFILTAILPDGYILDTEKSLEVTLILGTQEDNKITERGPVSAVPASPDGADYPISMLMPGSGADAVELMRFSWNGEEYSLKTSTNGTGSGIAWTCDADGNFTMEFSKSGTLEIITGYAKDASAQLIGGGAGGGHAEYRKGGSGGGAGEKLSGAVPLTAGLSIDIKVGSGGDAGTVSSYGSWYPDYNGGPSFSEATDGTDSSIIAADISLIAKGGKVNEGGKGGSGTEAGASSANGGGGGGSIDVFYETDSGNFRGYGLGDTAPNYSCHICGHDSLPDWAYGIPGWTILGQSADDHRYASGGSGSSGSGKGANPGNGECGNCPLQNGGNGVNGAGGGGGGGAFAPGIYATMYDGNGASRPNAYYYTNGGKGGSGKASISGKIEPKREVIIEKTSAIPEITDGNSCYSLEGAVYGVYSDPSCDEAYLVARISTDANGHAQTEALEIKTYFIKELVPSKGYLLDPRVYTLNMAQGSNSLTVKEVPGNDPVAITITKVTDDPAATLPSLEGTQFTIKFYGAQYSSVSELPEAASKTWIIETKARTVENKIKYDAFLKESYKVGGDDFYLDSSGNAVLPLGTLTVQETKPADGYTLAGGYVTQGGKEISDANGIILLNITSSDSISGGGLNYGNVFTKTDKALYGGVKVQKYDAESGLTKPQGAGALSDAEFKIISLNDKDITVAGAVYSKGQAVYSGKTDENGLFKTASDLLPMGSYKIVETKAPSGYLLDGKLEQEFKITENAVLVDLTAQENAISDRPIRADFSLTKQDGDSKEPMANVLFSITSNTSGESHNFSTDENGFFSSAGSDLHFGAPGEGGALIYDSYTIQELECEANKGYTLAEPINFTVDGTSVLVQIVGVYNYFMRMQTEARFQPSGSQWSIAKDGIRIRDTVSLENLVSGADYVLVGKLWNKNSGEFLINADGSELTCSKSFRTAGRSTVQTMDFDAINAEDLAGVDLVVFEYLYKDDKLILSHADENDQAQSLHFPKIATTAKDEETGSSISLIKNEICIVDTVSYTGLEPGSQYTVKGKLINAASSEPAHDAEGKEIYAETSFTAENSSGSVDVKFIFKGSFKEEQKFVAFEELYSDSILMAAHTDISDEAQTVYIPCIATSAASSVTGDNIGSAAEMLITDTISYKGLKPGIEYVIKGKIVLQDKPDTILTEAETIFTPGEEAGEVKLELNLNAAELGGKALVVYEEIYMGDKLIALHKDVNDKAQTIYIPAVKTEVKDKDNGGSFSLIADEITVIDTVSYSGLKPGAEYTLKGQLMDKSSGQAALDAEGKEILAETVFTADKSDGTAEVNFVFKGKFETSKKFVAFERLYYKDIEVAVHTDIEDEAQTIYIPQIRTTAMTPHTGEHIGTAGEMTVIDTVSYEGLKPGLEYILYGLVVDSQNPDTVLGGAMTVFTPETENGTAELTLKIDAKDYAGKTVVVYEEIVYDTAVIAVHKDAGDLDQSIIIPIIHTTAKDAELGGNTSIADEEVSIVDTVSYENLIPGVKYLIEGKIVLKSDPEKILSNAELEFTPEGTSGELELEFTFNASELAGQSVVAFETLKYKGAEIAAHADINDSGQTVVFPGIKTVATVGGEKDAPSRDRLTLVDEITYCNLSPGESYTVSGVLVNKDTGKPQKDADGREIHAETTFVAKNESGKVWLTFNFNGSNLKGKTLVAFERLYLGNDTDAQPIAVHEDIASAEQSVKFRTDKPKTGDENNAAFWAALAAVSAAAGATIIFMLRRRKTSNK